MPDRCKVVQIQPEKGLREPTALADAGIEFVAAECWTRDALAQYAADADIVWTWGKKPILTRENLPILTKCGAIVRVGSGTDDIDVQAATELGIIVSNQPYVLTDYVSDHAIALLLAVVRQVSRHDRLIHSGQWDRFLAPTGLPLAGSTLGLVGFGRIPQRVAHKLANFNLTILAHDPYVNSEAMAALGVRKATLDETLQSADFVSLHCPLTAETRHLIGERELRLMKPTALLINTARGAVVDEAALIKALQEAWIAGAGLDVLEKEPPDPDNPLTKMEKVVLTPHIAGWTALYPHDFQAAAIEAILDLFHRRWPRSVVNPTVKPRWGQLAPRT
jgi:D-3-phosphoglycerate dehydrogenase / 2-oxoglutarate reductase